MSKVIVSNVRLPEDEWLQLKTAAASMGMSINEYIRYLFQMDAIRSVTGVRKTKTKVKGYAALEELIDFASKTRGKPMRASEDDKVIYDI